MRLPNRSRKADAKGSPAKPTPAAPATKADPQGKAKGQGNGKPPKALRKAAPVVPDASHGGGEGANKGKGKGKGKGGGKDNKAKPPKPPAAKDSSGAQSSQRPACFFYQKGHALEGRIALSSM